MYPLPAQHFDSHASALGYAKPCSGPHQAELAARYKAHLAKKHDKNAGDDASPAKPVTPTTASTAAAVDDSTSSSKPEGSARVDSNQSAASASEQGQRGTGGGGGGHSESAHSAVHQVKESAPRATAAAGAWGAGPPNLNGHSRDAATGGGGAGGGGAGGGAGAGAGAGAAPTTSTRGATGVSQGPTTRSQTQSAPANERRQAPMSPIRHQPRPSSSSIKVQFVVHMDTRPAGWRPPHGSELYVAGTGLPGGWKSHKDQLKLHPWTPSSSIFVSKAVHVASGLHE